MDSYKRTDGSVWRVSTWHGEGKTLFYVIDPAEPNPVASYSKRWQAENHAINGCPCPLNQHYYGLECQLKTTEDQK